MISKKTYLSLFIILTATVLAYFSTPIKGLKDTYYMIFIHPPFAWTAYLFFVFSAWKGYKYIKTNQIEESLKSSAFMSVGYIFIIYAAFSGMAWGKIYWGDIGLANLDPKFVSIVFVLIIYTAYFLLKNSVTNEVSRLRVSTLYAIICLPFTTFFIFIMPRLSFSLHPDNPIFSIKKTPSGGASFSFGAINLSVLLLMFAGILLLALEIYKIKLRINKIENEVGELYE